MSIEVATAHVPVPNVQSLRIVVYWHLDMDAFKAIVEEHALVPKMLNTDAGDQFEAASLFVDGYEVRLFGNADRTSAQANVVVLA